MKCIVVGVIKQSLSCGEVIFKTNQAIMVSEWKKTPFLFQYSCGWTSFIVAFISIKTYLYLKGKP